MAPAAQYDLLIHARIAVASHHWGQIKQCGPHPLSFVVIHTSWPGRWVQLSVSARNIWSPFLYFSFRLYVWSLRSILCNSLGVLLTGFLHDGLQGFVICLQLYCISLVKVHASNHAQVNTIACSSFSTLAYRVSSDINTTDILAILHHNCPCLL